MFINSLNLVARKYKHEELWQYGQCKNCKDYDTEKGMCTKYTMYSGKEQTCKSYERKRK